MISEGVSILVFVISVVGFTRLVNGTIQSNFQMDNVTHSIFMTKDILSRMELREAERVNREYVTVNSALTCPSSLAAWDSDPVIADLQKVFCTHNSASTASANNIPDMEWEITCLPNASTCPAGSGNITVSISWPDTTSENLATSGGRFSYEGKAIL